MAVVSTRLRRTLDTLTCPYLPHATGHCLALLRMNAALPVMNGLTLGGHCLALLRMDAALPG